MSRTNADSAYNIPVAPVFVQAGTAATGTGAVTPTIPTNLANDIILVFAQSGNQTISMTTGGYTQIGPQPGSGTAAAAAANRLAVFWKRSAGAEGNPTVADSGDHTTANCIVIRGCITTGDPFNFISSGPKTTASTTLTATGGSTSVDNMLVIVFAAQSVASASAQFSSWANSSLVSITEASDDSGTGGTGGGGVASAYGIKSVAGLVTSTTATEANSTVDSFLTIAMVPANITQVNPAPWVYEYLNSSGTDIAVIPTNAVTAEIISIAAGGAGGSGIASTAAGGGGGAGGAGYRKLFKVSELISPLQIVVGAGGVGGATKSPATNTTVKNNNGSGNTLMNAQRGGIGADATSNSGGAGGTGGSVATANGFVLTSSASPYGGAGQTGGAGGTTGAGPAVASEFGGAGGGGGKNASNTTGVGGSSIHSGAGGGGGGSATQGANGGVGGAGQAGGSGAATGGSATPTGIFTVGGSGGGGGATGSGGNGAQPGGGGGGGGAVANSGGNGADGSVVVIFNF